MRLPNLKILNYLSDNYMFPLIQAALISFLLFCLIQTIPKAGANLSVGRGAISMSIFYGFYAAISGLLIAICLSTETKIAKDYKVFWTLLDVSIIFYLCLVNIWFRNKLLGWAIILTKIDM